MANTVTITVDADTKTAEKDVSGMSTRMQTALKGVTKAAAALTAVAAGAAALGQNYQEATNKIVAGTGATGEQLDGLIKSFENVTAGVPQDFGTVAAAVADINTEMGLEGPILEDVTKAFLDVSRAMEEDAGPMIKSVADSMISFGIPAEDTREVLDKLTAASQNAGVPMTALADTMVKFGPQLQELGLPFDDSIALLTNMEDKGVDAAKMMPGLNTAIKKLADEGVTDISAGLQDAITEISNAATSAEALGIATDLFGAGAGVRFKQAIDLGTFALDDLLLVLDESDGKVDTLGTDVLTTSEKFDMMKNKVKLALTPIGNFATAIGPMVIMLPAIATGISAMAASQVVATAATWLQTAAMAALNFALGPIGLIIIGIAAAIAGIVLVIKNWDKVTAAFQIVWSFVWGKIKSVFEPVIDALMTALSFLGDSWSFIWGKMVQVVVSIANPIIGVINTIIGAINSLLGMLNNIKIGWEAKKVMGVTVVPAFSLDPFNFAMIPKIPEMVVDAAPVDAELAPVDMSWRPPKHQAPALKLPYQEFAEGGIVRSPTLALLGERGPEAVVPLGARGASGGVTINILGPTYGFDDFERRVSQAIKDGVRRGGYSGVLSTA